MKISRYLNFRLIALILLTTLISATQVHSQCTVTITASPGTTVCEGTAVTLTASGATTYSWSSGDTSGSATHVYYPSSTTSYAVTGSAGTCTDVASITITVNPKPSVTISVSGNDATANPSGGTPSYTFLWSNGVTSSLNTALAPGSYSVTVTDVNGCTGVASVDIGCTVTITASDLTVCPGTSVTLTATGATTYHWFNDSTGPSSNSVIVNPTTTTTYFVTGTTGTCKSRASITINVSSPSVTIAVSGIIASATVSGGTSPYTYLWSPYLETSSSITLTTLGTYSVIVTDASGCTATASFEYGGPCDATFSVLPDSTTPQTILVLNNSTGTPPLSYQWSWGDGSANDYIAAPTHTYTVTGTYTMCLTITDGSGLCSDFFCQPIVVSPIAKKSKDETQALKVPLTVRVILPLVPCDSIITSSLDKDSCDYCVDIANMSPTGITQVKLSVNGGTLPKATATGSSTVNYIGTSSALITFPPAFMSTVHVCLRADPDAGNKTGEILANFTTIHPADKFNKDDSCMFDSKFSCNVAYVPPGGDSVDIDQVTPSPSNVRTYALYLINMNKSKTAIDRVDLSVSGKASILAVGPPQDSSKASISFAKDKSGHSFVFNCATSSAIRVGYGERFRTIYLTLAGAEGSSTNLHYTTYDNQNNVLSDDNVVISAPLSIVRSKDNSGFAKKAYLLSSFPNPTATTMSFQVHLDMPDVVGLYVTDALGNEVGRIVNNEWLDNGEHIFMFSTARLSSGSYYVTLTTSQGRDTQAIKVIR